MHWLELKPRNGKERSDNEYLAKLPLMPYKFLYEKQDYVLALYKSVGNEGPFYLQTDHDGFFNAYRKYYMDRFETKVLESNFSPPSNCGIVIGNGKKFMSAAE